MKDKEQNIKSAAAEAVKSWQAVASKISEVLPCYELERAAALLLFMTATERAMTTVKECCEFAGLTAEEEAAVKRIITQSSRFEKNSRVFSNLLRYHYSSDVSQLLTDLCLKHAHFILKSGKRIISETLTDRKA
jgi:AraC-like DNA-binding protein